MDTMSRDLLDGLKATVVFTLTENAQAEFFVQKRRGETAFNIINWVARQLANRGYTMEILGNKKRHKIAAGTRCHLRNTRILLICHQTSLKPGARWLIGLVSEMPVHENSEIVEEIERFLADEEAILNEVAVDIEWKTFREAEESCR
jgi:hypothetical protein